MFNTVILVGRLVRDPELQLTDTGKKRSFITLAVSRGYKNQNGEYETDFLDCTLWTGIAENTAEYCKSGDVVGVKGRLQTWILENDDGTKQKKMEIVAERVTFLANAKNKEENSVESVNFEEDDGSSDSGLNDDETTEIQVVKETEKKYKRKKRVL